jgi:hypothetical protein
MHLDPFSELYSRTPAVTWQRLLDAGEHVGYDDELGVWVIAGHHLVRTALRDTQRFTNAATLLPLRPLAETVLPVLAGFNPPPVASMADPPTHERSRTALRAVMPNTTARVEWKWDAVVQAHVDDLVGQLAEADTVDLVTQLAARLPVMVLLDIIGVPGADVEHVMAWSSGNVDLRWGDLDEAEQLRAAQGLLAIWRYCHHLVGERSAARDHGTGLLGDLLRYRGGDDNRLRVDQIRAIVLALLLAGSETTTALITHTVEHALTQPDRWARAATDEHYVARHVEETLRFSPPIDGWLRLTTTTVLMADTTIPARERCLLLIGAANHDPTAFVDPHTFDPDRSWLSQNLAFGTGAHYCSGAGLARLQATTVLRTLAQRLPHLRLPDGYQRHYRPNAGLRNHVSLPVNIRGCPMEHATPPARST